MSQASSKSSPSTAEERTPISFERYRTPPGSYDEMRDANGALRPHWQPFWNELARHSPAEWMRRWETGERFLGDQGVSYNVYGEPDGLDRPWRMDPIPFLIPADEYHGIERALVQRATLLDRVLADCLGQQTLVRSGWLPPALVFGQPDFLRPLHGVRPVGGRFLTFYAADLARSPDGRWWVTADRTQIPTGSGYTLANRLASSRMLPEAFAEMRVRRLAAFFRQVQSRLSALAPRKDHEPRIVILTPGPYNETYFEQAYLARYLGYTLVEGQDLTVRDDRVFLKTLSGLEPVDVILRRVDDDFCDALELRNDSMLCVPGLVEVVRRGNVAIANALGSGLVQSPALMAFLPSLCRHVLNEDLLMPSVATWWCGQESIERYVEENFDRLELKPAFRTPPKPLPEDRENALREIRWKKHAWIAQERVPLSTAPLWEQGAIAAGPISIRFYLVATEDGYSVMPGGLARIAPDSAGRFVSLRRGGASKDVWISAGAEPPKPEITLLSVASRPVELRRVGNNLPSRLADNFFWLGRYAERADATARLLRCALIRFNPERTGSTWPVLAPLLTTLEKLGLSAVEKRDVLRQQPEALEGELLAAVFAADRAGSLHFTANELRRLAVLVRDRTSTDFWRVVRQLEERLTPPPSPASLLAGDAIAVLNQALLDIAAFNGLANDNMTKSQGWRFLDMGRRIERSLQVCTLTESVLAAINDDSSALLEAMMEICDCSITYRSRYTVVPQLAAVCDLALLDDTNPRSLLYQLNQLEKHFDRLPPESLGPLPGPGKRILIEGLARLKLADPCQLGRPGQVAHQTDLARAVRQIGTSLPMLSDTIAVNYFAHSSIAHAGMDHESTSEEAETKP